MDLFNKNQSYGLSPDQYLEKFETPHSVISQKGNKEKYQSQQQLLEEILSKYNQNSQTKQTKQKAIGELNRIVDAWLHQIIDAWKAQKSFENMSAQDLEDIEFDAKDLGYGLKIFGSYSLKTNSFDGDIDMICVVPDFVSREKHFYGTLVQELKNHLDIKEVLPIQAIVPLIKMSVYGVQIDLLISRIPVKILQENPEFFQGSLNANHSYISTQELRSINGYRTSLYLKKNIKHYKNYQVVLKAIKMWAKNKGIYSQIFGFLGGAALSIMLAKICQLYPNYSPLQLLDRFFFIYANWVWTMPVCIETCNEIQEKVEGGMQIYTPLEPHMNSAHYLSKITCHITRKYLRLASKLIQEINRKKKDWKDLFRPLDFFDTYSHFIQMSVMGEKLQQFILWKGNIESKIRKLIKLLENQIEHLQLIEIHPYPINFIAKHPNYKLCNKYYFGIKCESNPSLDDYCEVDFTQSIRFFIESLETYSQIDKLPKDLNIGFAHVEVKDIDKEILEKMYMY